MMNGFHGVDNAICNLGYQTQQGFNSTNVALMQGQNALQTQLSDCCCQTQRAIDGVNYNMATNTCAITNQMNNNTRDIIDSQNAGTRAILDYLCQDKIATLQNENQSLRLAASQANQNAVLQAAMDANTAEIIRRTGNDSVFLMDAHSTFKRKRLLRTFWQLTAEKCLMWQMVYCRDL